MTKTVAVVPAGLEGGSLGDGVAVAATATLLLVFLEVVLVDAEDVENVELRDVMVLLSLTVAEANGSRDKSLDAHAM